MTRKQEIESLEQTIRLLNSALSARKHGRNATFRKKLISAIERLVEVEVKQ